jgi:hypothetical protein
VNFFMQTKPSNDFPCIDCLMFPICRQNTEKSQILLLIREKCQLLQNFVMNRGVFDLDYIVIKEYFESRNLFEFY